MYEDWLETYELGIKPQTAYVTKGTFFKHILPELGNIPIQKDNDYAMPKACKFMGQTKEKQLPLFLELCLQNF